MPSLTPPSGSHETGSKKPPLVWIGVGAVVRDSVVMGRIGDGASVERCVIGADAVVEAGEQLADMRRPDPDRS